MVCVLARKYNFAVGGLWDKCCKYVASVVSEDTSRFSVHCQVQTPGKLLQPTLPPHTQLSYTGGTSLLGSTRIFIFISVIFRKSNNFLLLSLRILVRVVRYVRDGQVDV